MEIDIKDHIPVNVLENYIEKYPEDAEKWLEFINIKCFKMLNLRCFRNISLDVIKRALCFI